MDGDLDSGGRYPAPRCSDDFRIELSEASDACAILVNQTSSSFPQIFRQDRCDCLGWNPIIVSEKCSLQQGDYFDIHEDIQWCFARILAQGPATPTIFPTIATIIPTKPPLTSQETNTTIRHPIVYVMETTNHPAITPNPTQIVIVCSLGVVILLCALLGLLYMISLKLTENTDMAMIDEFADKNSTTEWNGECSPERRASVQVQKNTNQFLPPVQPSLAKKNSTSDTIGNNEGSAYDSRRTKRRKKKAKHKHKGQHQRPNDGHPPPRTNGGPRKNGGYQLRINGIHSDNMVRNSRKKELRRTRTKFDTSTKSSPSQTPSPSKELRLARGHSDPTVRHTSRKERSKARARSSKNDTKESSDGTSNNKKVEKNRTTAISFHRMDSSSDLSTSLSVSHDLQIKPSKKKPGHLTQTKRRRKAKKRKGDSTAITPSVKANKLGPEAPDTGKLGARKTSRKVKKKRKRPKKSSERTLRPSKSPEPTTPSVRDEVALKALQYENIVLQKELQDLKEATKTEESSGQGTFFQRKSTLTQLKEAVSRMEKAKSIAAAEKHESSAIHPTLEALKSKNLELYE